MKQRSSMRWGCVLALLAATGCRPAALQGTDGELRFDPTSLDLGHAIVGTTASAAVAVHNDGRSDQSMTWDEPAAPFSVGALPSAIPSGEVAVDVHFNAEGLGEARGALVGRTSDGKELRLDLLAVADPVPACPTPVACHTSVFDLAQAQCVEAPLPDGTTCDPHSACVLHSTCLQGRCVGDPLPCDDGDACTLDVCTALNGCEHPPAPPCPGNGKCQVGVCDPKVGCGTAPAKDGASCGPTRTCEVADVCIAGSCVQRDPPDGFVCAEASPCQSEGRCVGAVCEHPEAVPLTQTWAYNSATVTPTPLKLHDLLLEPAGELTLSGFFEVPQLRVNSLKPLTGETRARRCMFWNNRLVCADYPYPNTGRISAIDQSTGKTRWTFDISVSQPDFLALSDGALFMARLAAVGSDLLAAVFEGFPRGSTQGGKVVTQCRIYFLVLLDVNGAKVKAVPIKHPFLETCNHPHPYGIAASPLGELYVAFSPSALGVAPLVAAAPTMMMAINGATGAPSWTRTEWFKGGEMALASEVLYPEFSHSGYRTPTGEPLPSSQSSPPQFGRVVATYQNTVLAPAVGASALTAVTRDGKPAWTTALATGESFRSDILKLVEFQATAQSSPEQLVLGFTALAGAPQLWAASASTGQKRWSCPLGDASTLEPQIAEVGNGVLAVMDSSKECGHCDPPFAASSASFRTYAVPGIKPARTAWLGTNGGPAHDNQERTGTILRGPSP